MVVARDRRKEPRRVVKEKTPGLGELRAHLSLPAGNGPVYACTVMGKATDANGGSFAMKLSCRIKG